MKLVDQCLYMSCNVHKITQMIGNKSMNTQRHKTVGHKTSTTHTMLRDAQVLEAKEKQGYTAGASHLPDLWYFA